MKKYMFYSAGLLGMSLLLMSMLSTKDVQIPAATDIEWMSLEQAVQASQKEDKPLMIDVYTDWCKWCKVMDESTFQDPEMIQYLNENFYAVKLNAEQKQGIVFDGKTYQYRQVGRRGINEVVLALLGDRPSYPSLVLLDGNLDQKKVLKGYQKKAQLLPVLSQYKKENLLTSN